MERQRVRALQRHLELRLHLWHRLREKRVGERVRRTRREADGERKREFRRRTSFTASPAASALIVSARAAAARETGERESARRTRAARPTLHRRHLRARRAHGASPRRRRKLHFTSYTCICTDPYMPQQYNLESH